MQPVAPPPAGPKIEWPRVLGITLISTGILGLVISIAGLIFVAIAGSAASGALSRELNTLDRALAATNDGLVVADSSLAEARTTLSSLSTTLEGATRAISDTQPTLAALEDLTGEGLPETIGSTRQALASAEEAARSAEGVLRGLNFFGLNYSPEVPLDVAIGEVSDSLGALNPSLAEVSLGLGTAGENLAIVADDLAEVAAGLDAIASSMGEATAVIEQYQSVVGDLRGELEAVREAAPGWITAARVGLSLLLIWLGFAQVGPLTQGWALVQRANRMGRGRL